MTELTHISTETLPRNVFDLQHDDFYKFVERQCGSLQAEILQFQLISQADIFIECQNPVEIMQYNSEKLKELKVKSCLATVDGSHIVLPGIAASFQTLKKRLLKRITEDLNESKRKKGKSLSLTPSPTAAANQPKSIDELRKHINDSIDHWFESRRDEFHLQDGSTLAENIDYYIEFIQNNGSLQSAIIGCSCGSKSTLGRPSDTANFQLSNFYRHLEHRGCSIMVNKLSNVAAAEDDVLQPSTNANDQISQSAIVPSSSMCTTEVTDEVSNRKRPSSVLSKTHRRRAKRQRR